MTVLARDAAEILFEMAAMQDKSPEAHDMLEKSQQIEVNDMGPLQLTLLNSLWPHFLCSLIICPTICLFGRQPSYAEHNTGTSHREALAVMPSVGRVSRCLNTLCHGWCG